MIDKRVASAVEAVSAIEDGMTVAIGGFGLAGLPMALIEALCDHGVRHLTVISNNAGNAETGLAALLKAGQVDKIICSFPRQADSWVFDELYRAGKIALELIPQGNIAERLRAAGAGIGAFYNPTGVDTALTEGREVREINGRRYVLEYPLHCDVALIKARRADRWGNLQYRMTAQNFAPAMAMAAKHTIAEVHEIVPLGALDPEAIPTPGIFVQALVEVPDAEIAAADARATNQSRSVGGIGERNP